MRMHSQISLGRVLEAGLWTRWQTRRTGRGGGRLGSGSRGSGTGTQRSLLIGLVIALVVGVLPGGAVLAGAPVPGGMRVVVSVPPLKGLVEPLLPAGSVIEVLIPPGVSEHGYEIPPSKVASLATADLVVIVGLGLEPQVEKFLAERVRGPGAGEDRRERSVVVFGDVVGLKSEEHEHEHEHAAGEDGCGEHHHHGVDPHLWLDPVMVQKLVPALAADVRTRLEPGSAERARLDAAERDLLERVGAVHAEYLAALAKTERSTIVVGHDAWGRLGARYEFTTVAIAGLTASEPTPAAMQRAIGAVREHGVPVIFLEPQLNRAAGTRIASATGTPVRMLDPLGDGDWFGLMRANLVELKLALGAAAVVVPSAK